MLLVEIMQEQTEYQIVEIGLLVHGIVVTTREVVAHMEMEQLVSLAKEQLLVALEEITLHILLVEEDVVMSAHFTQEQTEKDFQEITQAEGLLVEVQVVQES